jgi:glycosyl hydrolase family 123
MIDAPGTSNRIMQWVAWKFHIEGELYYSMNEAYAYDKDPWTNPRFSGGNGDGTLFYPGRPSRIGGHTDIPIESIRLKLIREGMEDYEYLTLLAKLAGQKTANEYSDRIVKEPYLWESRPEVLLKVRLEIGEAIDRLSQDGLAERE